MPEIKTFVYFDLEATGLKNAGKPRITELSLVAVNQQDVLGKSKFFHFLTSLCLDPSISKLTPAFLIMIVCTSELMLVFFLIFLIFFFRYA